MEDYGIEEGGYLLIDKPLEWTSFDVVKKLRNVCRIKKIGHAGTLDPLATGLLILCYGNYTKKIEGIQAQEKEYTGTFKVGETTPSFDLETEVDARFETSHINAELIEKTRKNFLGEITQVPPVHSAVKVNGKRAYEHARKGEDIKLKSRQVNVYNFELDQKDFPTLHFVLNCSKGTYVRSLARDFGKEVNSGAYLTRLRRTKIGEFSVDNAAQIADLKDKEAFFKAANQF